VVIKVAFTKLKMFIKTGKTSPYVIAKELLLNNEGLGEIKELISRMEEKEKESLVQEVWDKISEDTQKTLVSLVYSENWEKLLKIYWDLDEEGQIRTLEILGFIPKRDVVNFLLDQLKNKKEVISLTAGAALKNQPPDLTLEPMLEALMQPEQWLPSRVYLVLREQREEILPFLLAKVNELSPQVQQVVVQILGEIGDDSCLPVLEKLAKSPDQFLRKRVGEALGQLRLKSSWPILVRLLNDPYWPVRLHAVETLAELGVDKALPILEERKLVEKDPLILECIQEAIEKIEDAKIPITVNWVRK